MFLKPSHFIPIHPFCPHHRPSDGYHRRPYPSPHSVFRRRLMFLKTSHLTPYFLPNLHPYLLTPSLPPPTITTTVLPSPSSTTLSMLTVVQDRWTIPHRLSFNCLRVKICERRWPSSLDLWETAASEFILARETTSKSSNTNYKIRFVFLGFVFSNVILDC